MNQPAAPTIDREAVAKAMLKAATSIGGQTELARLLRVTPPLVNQWCKGKRVVLADYCPVIERATRDRAETPDGIVTCEDLRPDVAWGVLRMQAAPTDQQQAA